MESVRLHLIHGINDYDLGTGYDTKLQVIYKYMKRTPSLHMRCQFNSIDSHYTLLLNPIKPLLGDKRLLTMTSNRANQCAMVIILQ